MEFPDVRRRIAEYGELAVLVTVTPDGSPHVGTAVVAIDNDHVCFRVGPRTRANLEVRPRLSLTWPPSPDGAYQLILDGVVAELGEPSADGSCAVSVRIDRGILHRLADRPDAGPSCAVLGPG